jgi:hypothetical protein
VVDDICLHPEKLYSKQEFEEQQRQLNIIRREAVEKIGGSLHGDIRKVFDNLK